MSSTSKLAQLKQHTIVVADTGDFEAMKEYEPRDATPNPSLILKAVQQEAYRPILDKAIADHNGASPQEIIDHVLVAFGLEILKIIPGRVSTETDARLSFDTTATVAKARHLIALYEQAGISRDRVLIKIASTWEGACAAEILEKEDIRCNMTLLFSLTQAAACANAKAQLISPFVGRITDWYKKTEGKDYSPSEDPGVNSVKEIYTYYKHFGHKTEVMGASFRNVGQILELAGCDLLTISPELLQELHESEGDVPRKLSKEEAMNASPNQINVDQPTFRYMLNEDAMATEKLAEGIRKFAADAITLEKLISSSC